MMELPDHDRAFYDDGEWVGWDEINQQIEYKEWRAKYPNADLRLVPIFNNLLSTAACYHADTGKHLHVYGDIGELYGAITHGIRLNRNYAQGSDGRLCNDLIEIKTISPMKRTDTVEVNMARNFSQLLIVRINENFDISGKLIDRKSLPKTKGKCPVSWSQVPGKMII
jgi:hypothetical protein